VVAAAAAVAAVAVAQRPLRRAERQRLLRAAREGQRASDNSDESSCSSKRGAASSEKPRLKKAMHKLYRYGEDFYFHISSVSVMMVAWRCLRVSSSTFFLP